MDVPSIKKLLEEVAAGLQTPAQAMDCLRDFPFADLEIAKHDSHRPLRNGFSEVILCEGKEEAHLMQIVGELAARGANVFGTRAAPEIAAKIAERFPTANADPVSRTFRLIQRPIPPVAGKLAIVCAGTADLPVAGEARRTAEFFGIEPSCCSDVGVAGLHRLMSSIDTLRKADALIVVAGMEGALPSVIGGLVAAPIVAVPTSVGYGVHFGGIAALFAMLTSCAEGITVVNIDNGFGAACAALRILRHRDRTPR